MLSPKIFEHLPIIRVRGFKLYFSNGLNEKICFFSAFNNFAFREYEMIKLQYNFASDESIVVLKCSSSMLLNFEYHLSIVMIKSVMLFLLNADVTEFSR